MIFVEKGLVNMPASAYNRPVEASQPSEPDADYRARFTALKAPLKPPPPLTLKQFWEITVNLVRAARAAEKSSCPQIAESNRSNPHP
jgi:hypothetical protein